MCSSHWEVAHKNSDVSWQCSFQLPRARAFQGAAWEISRMELIYTWEITLWVGDSVRFMAGVAGPAC